MPCQVGTLINLRTIGSGSGQQVRGWVGLREPFAIGVTGFTRSLPGCGHPISAGGFGCGQPFEQSAWRKQQRAYHRELLVWRGFAVVVTTNFHTGGWQPFLQTDPILLVWTIEIKETIFTPFQLHHLRVLAAIHTGSGAPVKEHPGVQ